MEATGAEPARPIGLGVAAVASIGAGLIHAAAIGVHAEHTGLARLFIAAAVFQIGWGALALAHPRRWVGLVGAMGSLGIVGGWLVTRIADISWISGLEAHEAPAFADTVCAALGIVAAGGGLTAWLVGDRRLQVPRLALSALAVGALAIPAVVSVGNHGHGDGGHAHDAASAGDGHGHGDAAGNGVAGVGTNGAAGNGDAGATGDGATGDGATGVAGHAHDGDAATGAADHGHGATGNGGAGTAGNGVATGNGAATGNGTAGAGVATGSDTAGGAGSGAASEGHGYAAAIAPVPYDPTKPIDLGGVQGVTLEQQARAENLVAITLIRLPQFADPAYAESRGFRSIGDGFTGHEHYINWSYVNDEHVLDPDYPESLVYEVDRAAGTKTLVSAMFMLPDGYSLDTAPDIGGALTQWHIHDNLCFAPDADDPTKIRVVGLTLGDPPTCTAGTRSENPNPMIHVWITSHPCGPFAALEGVAAGQVKPGETHLCDEAHGAH